MKKLLYVAAIAFAAAMVACSPKATEENTEAEAVEAVEAVEEVAACDSCTCDSCACDTCACAAVVEEAAAVEE